MRHVLQVKSRTFPAISGRSSPKTGKLAAFPQILGFPGQFCDEKYNIEYIIYNM